MDATSRSWRRRRTSRPRRCAWGLGAALRCAPLLWGALTGCVSEPGDPPPPAVGCDTADPDATVGLRLCAEGEAGLTLVAANRSRATYLIDGLGRVVNAWDSSWTAGLAAYLTPEGTLLRAGKGGSGLNPTFGELPGAGGVIEEFDWDGDLLAAHTISGPDYFAHHDIHRLANGNVLALVWEALTAAEAVALGRPAEDVLEEGILMDALYEIDGVTGAVVWRWRTRDHLIQDVDLAAPNYGDPSSAPGRIDVNAGQPSILDWTHFNGLDHHPESDLIVVSAHGFDELWVIDHATTTAEATGPAGDLLFRWGRPSNWGGAGPQELFGQHDPTWVGVDRLLVFENGVGRPAGPFSRIVEVVVPGDAGTPRLPDLDDPPIPVAWSWTAPSPPDFHVLLFAGAQRLPLGNTLVTDGPAGRLFEIDPDGEVVWDYVSPVTNAGPVPAGTVLAPGENAVFGARRYALDGPALAGRDLTPGESLVPPP